MVEELRSSRAASGQVTRVARSGGVRTLTPGHQKSRITGSENCSGARGTYSYEVSLLSDSVSRVNLSYLKYFKVS